MDTPKENEKEKDSSVFNYMNSLSPIKSNSITQSLSSFNFESLHSVLPPEELRFIRQSNSYDPSNVAVDSFGDTEEEEIIIEQPQVPKNDGNNVAGNNDSSADGEVDLQKMYSENIKPSETPDWEALIPDRIQLIHVSESFSFLSQKRTSNSVARLCGETMATLKPVSNNNARANNETESSNALRRVRQCVEAGQASEEFHQSRPNKKRAKYNQGGRCNCKKSKCLKLYCECFVYGAYCTEPCSCLDCNNTAIHKETIVAARKQIESRNPHASFAPKVTRSSGSIKEVVDIDIANETSASLTRHRRGCNCKKSNCLKNYCECFKGKVGCSRNCRCEGCKNEFGRKDEITTSARSSFVGMDDQNETAAETVQQNAELLNHVPSSKQMLSRQETDT